MTSWDTTVCAQIRSVAQSCPTLCDPMNRSTPGLPVHHQLPEFTETHVHRVSDAIQPSQPLLSPSPPAPNPCVCYMNSMPKFPTVHVFFGKLVAGMLLGFNGNSSPSSINFKKQHSNIIKCSCLDVVFCCDLVYCRTSLLECACSVVYDCLQPYKLLPARLLFHGILQARIL